MGLREPTNFITTGPLGNSQRPEEFSQRFFGLEPFVDADVAAEFLLVKRKTILDWARGRVLFQRTRMGGESESCGVSESRKSLGTRDGPEHNGRRQSRDGQTGREVWLELRAKAGSEPENRARANSFSSATTPKIPQVGNGRKDFTSLGLVSQFPDEASRWTEWAGSDLRRSLTNPYPQ
jgi:hypothetical protein